MNKLIIIIVVLLQVILPCKGQLIKECDASLRVSIDEFTSYVDSSMFDLHLRISNSDRSRNYRVNLSEIWQYDLVELYCHTCSLDSLRKKLFSKGLSKILIEYDNGEFQFLSAFSPHAVNLIPYFVTYHHDKAASIIINMGTYSRDALIWSDKFRLYFFLREEENGHLIPFNCRTKWMKSKDFFH